MLWYLILKSNGKYEVIDELSIGFDCELNDLVTGTRVTLLGRGSEDSSAIIISASQDKRAMQVLLPRGYKQENKPEAAPAQDTDDADFSASEGSQWEPSDSSSSNPSDDSDTEEHSRHNYVSNKNFYTKNSKVLKPSNRVDPVIPNLTVSPVPQKHDNSTLMNENDYAQRLVRLINELTQKLNPPMPIQQSVGEIYESRNCTVTKSFYEDHSNVKDLENRSVVKENKIKHRNENKCEQTSNRNKDEWVPIGSGTTLIHRDEYSKINWSSYTKATRTLLLAAFPRQILATHSMTGKKSPAFPDKPAKLCLDQRITEDIILEITDRFKVKKNLVRTIITTKCADESKMMKIQKRKSCAHSSSKKHRK